MSTPRARAGAVFFREARRSSRRWQTYALRFGFAGAMLGALAVALLNVPAAADPAASGTLGRTLFQAYTGVQLAFVGLLAPLLVGLGVAEEREEGTLQLLVVTRLGPGRILWGKVGSRLLVLATFVVGGLPILALIGTFGGVGPWEIVNATANTLLVAGVLGTIGGIAGLFSGGGAGALALGLAWAVFAYLLIPGLFAVALRGDVQTAYLWLCPPVAMYEASPRGLLPALLHVPTAWIAARIATPLFAVVTGREDWSLEARADRDPDQAAVVRGQRRIGAAALAVVPWIAVAVALLQVEQGFYVGPVVFRSWEAQQLAFGVGLGAAALLLVAGTGLLVLLHLRVSDLLQATFGRRGGPHGSALLRAVRAFDDAMRPVRRWVWPNPVAWREVLTRGLGGAVALPRWAFLLALSGTSAIACVGGLGEDEVALLLTVGIGAAGALVGLLSATSTMVVERQSRTLPLLLTTTMRPLSIALGKLFAAGLATGPWLALALLTGVASVASTPDPYELAWEKPSCGDGLILAGVPGLRVAAVAAWVAAVWFALTAGCMVLAMRLRPARIAFGANLALVLGWLFAPGALALVLPEWLGEAVATLWLPFFHRGWTGRGCGTPWEFPVMSAVWLGVGLVLFLVLVLRFRAWALVEPPGGSA